MSEAEKKHTIRCVFKINGGQFGEISIDDKWIIAKRRNETCFELSVPAIFGYWKGKQRMFGYKLFSSGVILIIIAILLVFYLDDIFLEIIGYYTSWWFPFYTSPPLLLGIFLLFLWIYPKQEVMLIYTTGHTFRIEASEDFIKQVWDTVMRMQRLQD